MELLNERFRKTTLQVSPGAAGAGCDNIHGGSGGTE